MPKNGDHHTDEPDEPHFRVTEYRDATFLEPQFELETLSPAEREQFDALHEAFTTHSMGGVVLPAPFGGPFETGERVTFDELGERFVAAAHAWVKSMEEALRAFAPVAEELAEAIEPLAELAQSFDAEGDRR